MAEVAGVERGGTEGGTEGGGGGGGRGRGGERRGQADGGGEARELATPDSCIADFCLIPIGTSSASVSREVADVQRLLRQSNLTYSMHSAGTTVEGPWDQVMKLIGQAHTLLHQKGVVRVQTDIRVGSRTDKRQTPEDKVRVVEEILARD